MRAHFVRGQENPLDSLEIGRVQERKLKVIMADLKKAIESLVFELNLDRESIKEHRDAETISVSFNGEVRTIIGNIHPAEYYIGYDSNTIQRFYMGYEDMTTNETFGRNFPNIGECVNQLRIIINKK